MTRQLFTQAGGAWRPFRVALAAACALLVLSAGTARAEITFLGSFGEPGQGAGQFWDPAGIAVNEATDDVYIVDRRRERIQQFNSANEFVRLWGYDVVKEGEDNQTPANEVQNVTIRATSGTFRLRFGNVANGTSEPIPYDAEASEVQAILNNVPNINSGGGSVSVTGGPGDETGSTPYTVTFDGGPLAETNVSTLLLEGEGLGLPPGTQLTCVGGENGTAPATYQWLANGDPIVGATEAVYTPGAEAAGKAVQCLVRATYGQIHTLRASRPYQIPSPAPSPTPPFLTVPPNFISLSQSEQIKVGGEGGQILTCNASSNWTNAPESYTYQWYLSGNPIGSPTTTTETTNQYVTTEEDVETRGSFQCSVTGTNAGGSSTAFSSLLNTNPAPESVSAPTATVTSSVESTKLVVTEGGPVFEVCQANPPSTDVCQAGVAGPSMGQFNHPRGIAVDNSLGGTGDVYVIDDENYRIEKFTASGNPIMMLGKEVNKSTGSGICTIASEDVCSAGVNNEAAEPGGFGPWPTSGQDWRGLGNDVDVDNFGDVYVADARSNGQNPLYPRIQKFSPSGAFLAQVLIPSKSPNPGFYQRPISMGVDPSGVVYTTVSGEERAVEKFLPEQFQLIESGPLYGERSVIKYTEKRDPTHVATETDGDKVWVADRNENAGDHHCGEEGGPRLAIMAFDSLGHLVECATPEGPGELYTGTGVGQTTGIAIASDRHLLYAALGKTNTNNQNQGPNEVKVFELPEEKPPFVAGESVSHITTATATLQAQINAGFLTTSYKFQYGTENCETSTCTEVAAGSVYGTQPAPAQLPISGLSPNTRYHYRVIAENELGTETGEDRTFVTFPFVDLLNDPCGNALARKQTRTAGLFDCRAYELASAAFTGGYDVESDLVPGGTPFNGYPDTDGKLLYAVHDGGIPNTGNPTNHGPDTYVATRGQDGWSTTYVGIPSTNPFASGPFASPLMAADSTLDTFAFGGNDICNPCFEDGSTNVPLRLPNGELVQGMAGSKSPGPADPEGTVLRALSADGSHFVFGSEEEFEEGSAETGNVTIYARDLQENQTEVVSTLPNGDPIEAGNEVAELDISSDGSRIVIATGMGEDEAGNTLWHPYMHIGGEQESSDLAEGIEAGVLFAGMTSDGSRVFLSTKDQLLGEDEDENVDIYEAEVSEGGQITLHLLSVLGQGSAAGDPGEPSNDEFCEPPGIPDSWNADAGDGECNAVTLAGGAGVGRDDGTLYFVSPELLDQAAEEDGEKNQPNLYVVPPGQTPEFVATIDSSEGKPGPSPPEHPLTGPFDGPLSNPDGVAVDQATGDVYVADYENGMVHRFAANGEPDNFTAGPDAGTNTLTGFSWLADIANVAVDNSPGPANGDIYVVSGEFEASKVDVYDQEGEHLQTLTGTETPGGSFGSLACSVAVDQSTGDLYIGLLDEYALRYSPGGATVAETDFSGGIETKAPGYNCDIAADSGNVYIRGYIDSEVNTYEEADFEPALPTGSYELLTTGAEDVSADPATGEVYVDKGNKISVFDSSGTPLTDIGAGDLGGSSSADVRSSNRHVFAANENSELVEFGYVIPPYEPIDHPAVVHGVKEAGVHHYGDFQVTPDGKNAIFASAQPLKEDYDNAGFSQVYRYNAQEGLACASCLPTEGVPTHDAALPEHGLGITDDGRVFFNSWDQLVLRDTNGKQDAYQWEEVAPHEGAPQLISTGVSDFGSGLLSVTADGKDAYFFTRDQLVPRDVNGQAMKLYDAREGGGFFVIPEGEPCAASDECHGPGSQAAPPVGLGTLEGSGGNVTPAVCNLTPLSRRTSRLSRQAKRLRRRARKASGKRAAALHKRARRKAATAKRAGKATKRCRQRLRARSGR